LLTNNGKVTEKQFITNLNKRFNSSLLESQLILCHTPLRDIAPSFKNKVILTTAPNELGSAAIAIEYGFTHHINLIEYCCLYPNIASLTL
jgi:ribonucleotide monophosphatase NagD (HAD superfamily)